MCTNGIPLDLYPGLQVIKAWGGLGMRLVYREKKRDLLASGYNG